MRENAKERKELLTEAKQLIEEEKVKERENRLRKKRQREENLIRSATYQTITHTEKIKKMSKKQRKNVMKLADLARIQQPKNQPPTKKRRTR